MSCTKGLWLVALSLIAAPAAADQWDKRFTVEGRPVLALRTDDANVKLEAHAGKTVTIRVETFGYRIGPHDVRIRAEQNGNRVELEVYEPRRWLDVQIGRRGVEIVVGLPAASDVDVATGDGNIELGALHGTLSLSTGDGNIRLEGCRGRLRVRTGDGDIRGDGLDGTLTGGTNDGGLRISGRFDRLELGTGDGSIVAAAAAGSKVVEEWNLRSGDGSIVLRIPEDLRAEIDAQAGDGTIDVDLPIQVQGRFRRTSVRGSLNGGGPPIQIRTGDGSVRIAPSSEATRTRSGS
jgi:hypothetical protein